MRLSARVEQVEQATVAAVRAWCEGLDDDALHAQVGPRFGAYLTTLSNDRIYALATDRTPDLVEAGRVIEDYQRWYRQQQQGD